MAKSNSYNDFNSSHDEVDGSDNEYVQYVVVDSVGFFYGDCELFSEIGLAKN